MTNAIEIHGLKKKQASFLLDEISFSVPRGFVTGFIGQNGAGKTTALKLMLGMMRKDKGNISILGKSFDDALVKEDMGILLETPGYQEDWTPEDIEKVVSPFYPKWNSKAYRQYLQYFSVDPKQKFKTLSKGMKMKLGMAVTLSHSAKLLILDEPTSGLDPAARREMLDILREYMIEEDRTILFSSHNTGDLEKIADYITYIHKGKILYSGTKDDLLESFCIVRGGPGELPVTKRSQIIGLREYSSGFEGLIRIEDIGGFPPGVMTEQVSLEELMVYMGDKRND